MDWGELLRSLLYVVITICVPIAIKELYVYLKAKAKEASGRVEDQKARNMLNLALDGVIDAVSFVAQTYVDSLKKSGEFNEDTARIAFDKAKERAQQLITEEVKDFITGAYGDFSLWLETKIETEVKAQKSATIVESKIGIIED